MLVDTNQVFAKGLVHSGEGVTQLNHLLLDVLCILLALLLVPLLQDVIPVLGLLIRRDPFQLLLVNIVG